MSALDPASKKDIWAATVHSRQHLCMLMDMVAREICQKLDVFGSVLLKKQWINGGVDALPITFSPSPAPTLEPTQFPTSVAPTTVPTLAPTPIPTSAPTKLVEIMAHWEEKAPQMNKNDPEFKVCGFSQLLRRRLSCE